MKTRRTSPALMPDDCTMAALNNDKSRTDILNRLKRAEGQLRGIQRMIEEGEGCLPIATQMAAVRKALDSTYVRMTMCFMEQQIQSKLGAIATDDAQMGEMFEEIETLLGKIR
jgi:CsoR family transcriptional regulator, copper-sensing transcriptional repressor